MVMHRLPAGMVCHEGTRDKHKGKNGDQHTSHYRIAKPATHKKVKWFIHGKALGHGTVKSIRIDMFRLPIDLRMSLDHLPFCYENDTPTCYSRFNSFVRYWHYGSRCERDVNGG